MVEQEKGVVVSERVEDAETPGVIVAVDPDTAERMGAFRETALSRSDAWEASHGC